MKEQENINLIYFLKRSYYIQAHLSERLDELAAYPLFADFREVIEGTVASLNLQLNELDRHFESLGIARIIKEGEYIFPLLESAFTMIQIPEDSNAILSLLDYISVADALVAETVKITAIHQAQSSIFSLPNCPVISGTSLQPLKCLLKESMVADRVEN